jgi:diguanylate cyclase (GGDEF)-like protein
VFHRVCLAFGVDNRPIDGPRWRQVSTTVVNQPTASRLLGRLSARFTLLMGGLLIVFTLVFTSYNTVASHRALWDTANEQAQFLGQFGAELVSTDLTSVGRKNLENLTEVMRTFASRPSITYARVLDKYRRSVADGKGERPAFGAVSRDDLFDRAVRDKNPVVLATADTLHVAQPVFAKGELIGVLRFGIALGTIQAEALALVHRKVAVLVLFLLIALPMIALLTHRATSKVRSLTETTRRIADGELDTPIDTSGSGEITDLSRSVSRMVRALSENAAEIQTLTFIDPLTGLANRAQLHLRLDAAVSDLADTQNRVALLLVDVVRFQRFNDALGQERGDTLLRLVATRLDDETGAWREAEAKKDGESFETIVARLSADEFAIMLAGRLSETDLDAAIRRIMRCFDISFRLDEHVLDLSICMGIALAPTDGRTFLALVHNAGIALQAAKKAGRASHRFFAPELDERAYRRLVLESDLRQALARDEFEVFFQPQVTCIDGRAIGAEALIRWRHPERGLISPGEFIPIAEESGLIVDIGTVVIRKVCEQAAAWARRGLTPRLSLNVSSMQFHQPDFTETILGLIAAHGIDPRLIELEVTESVAMGDPKAVAAQMRPLREAGVRFAIDDFGTGYSSLSVLTSLPFDVLKIDRSFIRDIDTGDPERRALVATMLGMARALGLDAIAEGVERVEEIAFLNEEGCAFAQGFLFARPMPAAVFEPWYIAHRRNDARHLQDRLRDALAALPRAAGA